MQINLHVLVMKLILF